MGLGTINFKCDRGNVGSKHVAKTRIKGVADLASLQTLATTLGGFTGANVARQGFVDFANGTTAAPGTGVNSDHRGTAYFQDSSGGIHSITIPGWDDAAHAPVAGDDGDRMADADVAAIVAAINTATGESYTPLWGKIYTLS